MARSSSLRIKNAKHYHAHKRDYALIVEEPTPALLEALRRFRRGPDGTGSYENLFTLSRNGRVLVTLPGFLERVRQVQPLYLHDERLPLPEPDLTAMTEVPEVWRENITNAIISGGGTVIVPDILGDVSTAASIIKAFKHDDMLYRNTPFSVIAVSNRRRAQELARSLSKICNRDIKALTKEAAVDIEDIIVCSYDDLPELPQADVGIFIGTDLIDLDIAEYADKISGLRNAARWGVISTPAGGVKSDAIDIAIEGLFGPVVSASLYGDAIKAKMAPQVTVCWVEAPKPPTNIGPERFPVLEAIAMQENPEYVSLVADIVKDVPDNLGCICRVESCAMGQRVFDKLQELGVKPALITPKTVMSDKHNAKVAIGSGVARKAVVSETVPQGRHDVVVLATCRGREAAGLLVPWKPLQQCNDERKTYIVDFSHSWDSCNGRPGRLALNDEARQLRYSVFGFKQIHVTSKEYLPFL